MKKYCICCKGLLNSEVECYIHSRDHGFKNPSNVSLGVPESINEIEESQTVIDDNFNIGYVFSVNAMSDTILISRVDKLNTSLIVDESVTFDEFVRKYYILNKEF